MESINNRFKKLREACGKTQTEWGEILGIKTSGVSDIENERRNVTEKHLIMLSNWKEYFVNIDWLRTGEGGIDNMFVKPSTSDLAFNHFGYIMGNSTPQKKAVLSALIEMVYHFPDDQWNYVFSQFENCLEESKKKNSASGED